MDSDIPMVDAAPVAAHGDLPTESVVKGWTKEELYRFITSQILLDSEDRMIFQRAKVNGKIFLSRGDVDDFWRQCQLPYGPSAELAELVEKIKDISKEESRGNTFLSFSDVIGTS